MKIWKYTDSYAFTRPVVTVGIFDGVHHGHRFIIETLKKRAAVLKGETVVITLWPHPRMVLNKDSDNLRYLNSIEEKAILLEKEGVDHLVIVEFTKEFAMLGSCEFISEILVNKIRMKHLVVGYNHKFGRNREGDFNNLKKCADLNSFTLEATGAVSIENHTISSSFIRENLLNGNLEKAKIGLGYDYFLQGKVVAGKRLGREIGFPTANILPHDSHKLIPKDGVYAVNIKTGGNMYNGMLNIGFRPTINSGISEKSIEVNIFNFEGELYDEDITLFFRKRLRDEKKFGGIEQLRDQLVKDREDAEIALNI